MKIALPVTNGQLSQHFGHCETFHIIEINSENQIVSEENLQPPAHEPGVLPGWLGGIGVDTIIAGGMGGRAQNLFTQNGVRVVIGAESKPPSLVIGDYLAGKLITGDNTCDH